MKTVIVWVVFCEDEIMGIYPNDESKAQGTAETMKESGFKASVVKYVPVPGDHELDQEAEHIVSNMEGATQVVFSEENDYRNTLLLNVKAGLKRWR